MPRRRSFAVGINWVATPFSRSIRESGAWKLAKRRTIASLESTRMGGTTNRRQSKGGTTNEHEWGWRNHEWGWRNHEWGWRNHEWGWRNHEWTPMDTNESRRQVLI